MTQLIASSELTAVVGMGLTGMSVARFLAREQQRFIMLDTRSAPANLERFKQEFPQVPVELGALSVDTLCAATRIVLSPGVSPQEPAVQAAIARGVPVVGDIQLFVEQAKAPIVAITGSNGKSTVTTLVGELLKAAGKRVAVGGNLGTPALDLLEHEQGGVDYYVLELSSFQLETTAKLNAEVATILNISADHMDRHQGLPAYHAAKQRVYFGAKKVVVNRDDPLTQPPLAPGVELRSFGLDRPDLKHFGLLQDAGQEYLALGLQKLLPACDLKLQGKHNLANALAALAIGDLLQLPMQPMLDCLRQFGGLPHRCQWVATKNSVDFINDSKGTNVGATLAALYGLARNPSKLILIAGGEGKGGDFSLLEPALRDAVRCVVCIGVDGPGIAKAARAAGVNSSEANSMKDAVAKAMAAAEPGDAVLLSPACASFDMFKNYQDRGEQFVAAVQAVAA